MALMSGAPTLSPCKRELPSSGAGERIRALDGLRGLAILLVIVWHYLVAGNQADPGSLHQFFNRTFSFAWAGVDLFFVLSGFLIGGILIDRRGSDDYFSRFWLRRFARLMPLYLIVIGLYILALPAAGFFYPARELWLFDDAGKIPLWSFLLYVQNFYMAEANSFGPNWLSATWSLAVEEQFYLLAPLFLRFVPLRLLPGLLVALTVAALFIRNAYLGAGGSVVGSYVLLATRWEGLLVGILVAFYYRKPAVRAWLKGHPLWLMTALGILLAGLAWLIMDRQQLHSPFMMEFGYSYLPLVAAAVLLVALSVDWPVVKRVFVNSALVELGVISYGVYLLHQPVHGLVSLAMLGQRQQLHAPRDLIVALASFALTVAIASLSWRYIEKPVIDLAHRQTALPARWLRLVPASLRRPGQ